MPNFRHNKIYEFEDFRLDVAHLLLYRNEQQILLAPKVIQTLLALVERHGEVLSKDELMEIIWADSIVEEGNLFQNLHLLRKILGKTADGKPLIETLHRRGYRFNGDVLCVEPEKAENSLPDNAQSATPKIPTETHHFNVERRGNVLALADWKTNEQSEPENGDSQSQISESAEANYAAPSRRRTEKIEPKMQAVIGNRDGRIQTTGNLSSIVGREKEILHIKDLLSQTDVHLVTLAGVGGTGKTRLAQAVLQEMTRDFSDGGIFVELAAITNPELVASSVAQSLEVKEAGGKPILETLKDYLRDKQMLIVVDNFEQVIAAAPQIAEFLAAASNLKILITSRILLHLSAEREFVVPPLAVPNENAQIPLDELLNYEAVKLFVERAQSTKPNFALTNENATDVVEICARLDGLPLAIELAAARIKILSPRAILAKLENRLRLLTGGASDLPARQQTMRYAIEWSYDLLTEDEKHLFRQLSVFANGFTFEAAEVVCSNYELPITDDKSNENQKPKTENQIEILDLITSLVDKSLLASKEQAGDEQRFRMLETIREYALESLQKNNEAEAMRRNHAKYFLALGEEAGLHLPTERASEWLNRLEEEHDNLRHAIRWLFEDDAEKAARLAAAIQNYLINHCHLTEGREWLEAALKRGDALPAAVRFKLLSGLGYLAASQGEDDAARKFFEKNLAEGRATSDKRRIAESFRGLGTITHSQGNYAAARKFHEEGLAIHRELNNKFGVAASLNGLGCLSLDEGDGATARIILEESLMNFRLVGNESGISYCLLNLGAVAYFGGDYETAQKYYGEVLPIAQNLGYKDRVGDSLDGFAALAVKRGELEFAVRLAGAVERLREQIGFKSELTDRQRRNAYLAELKMKMDEAVFAELYEQGRKLKLEEAVALCKSSDEHLKKSHLFAAENATKILQATSDGNRQITKTNYGFTQRIQRFKSSKVFIVGALVVLIFAGYSLARWMKQYRISSTNSFQMMNPTRLTDTGNVNLTAISPDGNYAAYITEGNAGQSLWLNQVAVRRNVEIAPSGEFDFQALIFSRDNNFIYFVASPKDGENNALYQMPVTGGAARKLIDDIGTIISNITFSPDEKQIAFSNRFGANGESNIVLMNTDGSGIRKLATRNVPQRFGTLGWSPDGKTIVCSVFHITEGLYFDLLAVNVADGAERQLGSQHLWDVGTVAWMPDGDGFVMTAASSASNKMQVWFVSYPKGEARLITNDLNTYESASLTSNAKTLAVVQSNQTAQIYVAPNGDATLAAQITNSVNTEDGTQGLDWTPDGKIVYTSMASGNLDIWIMDADGKNKKQLTHSTKDDLYHSPSVSPDNRYIVFQAYRNNSSHIWRMDADGGNITQLTEDNGIFPVCSPDGKWVIYFVLVNGVGELRRVPLAGGAAEQLSKPNVSVISPSVSPDGKFIACRYADIERQPNIPLPQMNIAILPFDGGESIKTFPPAYGIYYSLGVIWMPDSRAFAYVKENDVNNYWIQPLDGTPARQFTNFTDDKIFFGGKWSRDGKQFAVVGGNDTSDVVLINNFGSK